MPQHSHVGWEDNFQGWFSPSHHVGLRSQTQIIKLGFKPLYPL